jgi:hypothetical protein
VLLVVAEGERSTSTPVGAAGGDARQLTGITAVSRGYGLGHGGHAAEQVVCGDEDVWVPKTTTAAGPTAPST